LIDVVLMINIMLCYYDDELLMYECIDLTMQWCVGVVIYYIMVWII